MITFYTGMPGDGKGMTAMRTAVKLLGETDCTLVTNIAIRPELHDYVRLKYPKSLDTVPRVKRLEEPADILAFFRFRSGGCVLPPLQDFGLCTKAEALYDEAVFLQKIEEYFEALNERPEEQRRGVLYIIDETQDYFNSKRWQFVSRTFEWYLSKHRHFHDEIIFLTQNADKVAKGLKDLTGRWAACKNMYARHWFLFKRRGRFLVEFRDEQNKSKPDDTESFSMDFEGLATTYDTHGAVTVNSTGQIKSKKKRLLPWWSLPVGIATLAIAAVLLSWFGASKGLDSFFALTNRSAQAAKKSVAQSVDMPVASGNSLDSDNSLESSDIEVTGKLIFRGEHYFILNTGARLLLSDLLAFDSYGIETRRYGFVPFSKPSSTLDSVIARESKLLEIETIKLQRHKPVRIGEVTGNLTYMEKRWPDEQSSAMAIELNKRIKE
jgi:hypothetical protein